MKSDYKNLTFKELYNQIFKDGIVTKQNKDKLFKLAKANEDIKTIEKMANELDFKSAKAFLSKQKNLSLEDTIKNSDALSFKKLVDEGADISKIKVSDLIDKRCDDEIIKIFIEKGYYVNIAQLVTKNYKVETIRLALENGSKIDDIYENMTGIAHACKMGRTNIVRLLLEFKPNINKKFSHGMTALWFAISDKKGNTEIIKLLIENGADVEAKMSHGFTPLIQASSDGNVEAVKLLLEHGANIEAQSAKKGTPLILSVVQDNYEVTELLLEKGANPNIIEITGATALDCARSQKFVDLLLQYNAKSGSEFENIPLLVQAVIDENIDLIQELIDSKSKIDIEHNQTLTPLIQASAQGSINIVNLLLDNGANINYRTKLGLTPLISATHAEQVEVIKILLQRGVNRSLKGDQGLTALDIATTVKPNAEIKRLLESNSTVSKKKTPLEDMMNQRVQNDYKELVLQKLIEFDGDENKVKTFFDNLSSPEKLQEEIGKNKKDSIPFISKSQKRTTLSNEETGKDIVIKSVGHFDGGFIHESLRGVVFSSIGTNIGYFLDFPLSTTIDPFSNEKLPYGRDWNNNDIGRIINSDQDLIFITYGNHIFLHVCENDIFNNRSIYKFQNNEFILQKEYKNYDYKTTDLYKRFFEITKTSYSNELKNEIEIIFNQNIDPNKINDDSKNALILAIETENIEWVNWLIQNGADVNIQDIQGFSPLMIATILDNYDICKLLVDSGANIFVKNYRGQDCGLFAAKNMNADIIMLFEEYDVDIQGPISFKINESEEKYALDICNKLEEELNDKKSISDFLIYALNINYDYEMNLDEYIQNQNGYLVSVRPGREYNFDKKVVETYDVLHKRYLDSINVSDESKNNIRTRIYDMLMDKYQLGKYENSKFIDIQDESQSEFIKTLKIIDNSLNGEIDIFDDHIVLKLLNNDEKTTSSTYEKISENKYFHKNKGEILISKLSIIRKDLQGNQDVLKYIELDSKIYNINTFHDPEALSKVLHNFSNNEKLRYTNHPWPDSLTYEKFYNDLTNGWKEIQNDIKSLSPTLHHYISMFLFGNLENEIIGFSIDFIKEKLHKGEKPDSIKVLSKSIDSFKQSILIKNDEGQKLIDLFERVLEKCNLDLNIDLEEIEDFKDRFYTDVKRLEDALIIILKDIHKINPNANIKISINSDNNIVDLKIIHENSSYHGLSEQLKNTIGQTGNFTTIFDSLKSVCDWEVETTCKDGAKVIHYLYKQKDGKPYSEPSKEQNNISNFTHTLRFYK